MDFVIPLLIHGVPPAVVFGIATWAVHHDNLREASRHGHYRNIYGLSPERTLVENPAERAEVLQARDSSKSGEMVAVRYVTKWDPIPLKIVIQLVRTL